MSIYSEQLQIAAAAAVFIKREERSHNHRFLRVLTVQLITDVK